MCSSSPHYTPQFPLQFLNTNLTYSNSFNKFISILCAPIYSIRCSNGVPPAIPNQWFCLNFPLSFRQISKFSQRFSNFFCSKRKIQLFCSKDSRICAKRVPLLQQFDFFLSITKTMVVSTWCDACFDHRLRFSWWMWKIKSELFSLWRSEEFELNGLFGIFLMVMEAGLF